MFSPARTFAFLCNELRILIFLRAAFALVDCAMGVFPESRYADMFDLQVRFDAAIRIDTQRSYNDKCQSVWYGHERGLHARVLFLLAR